MAKKVGTLIKEARTAAGLSQEQLDIWLDVKQALGRNIEAMAQE